MGIILLHGDDESSSRQRLNFLKEEAKKKGYRILNFGNEARTEEIVLASRSAGLFEENNLLIIENYFSSNRIFDEKIKGNIVFWEKGKLPKSILKKLPRQIKVEEFSLPPIIFQFLDNFYPKNRNLLRLLKEIEKIRQAESILPLLAWHIRLLLWAKMDPRTLNFWKKRSLIKQAEKFSTQKLLDLHKNLLEIDEAIKSSNIPASYHFSLDQLVLDLTE